MNNNYRIGFWQFQPLTIFTFFSNLDKETANLFIPFVRKNPFVTTNEQISELKKIKIEYEKMKKEIYHQYQYLFENEADFEKEYNQYNSFTVSHIDDWMKLN